MVSRPFWKGYLKLSLVTCPVALTPAVTDSEKVRFHTLNAKTGNRVISQYIDDVTGKPVNEDDQVKGYPRGEDDYIILEDEEIEAVALESTRIIDIEMFVPYDQIGWIWYDRPHYLTPNDAVGEEAFAVIREAMVSTKTVGISRLVMYRRERAVLLEPRDNGIVLWTLRYGDEVRDERKYFDNLTPVTPDPKLIKMIGTLIDGMIKPWDTAMVRDPVQDKLIDIIALKKRGKKQSAKTKTRPVPEPQSNVINIMDALRSSLKTEAKRK